MKKNDMVTFLVYALMIGLAVLVGLGWVRPLVDENAAGLAIPPILLVALTMVGGIIFNAVLLEIGHFLGAKAGHYKVLSFVILGIGFKTKNGVKKAGLHSFAGLTGETKIAPTDPEKNRLGAYISLPLLFLFLEIVICAVLVGVGNALVDNGKGSGDKSFAWMSIFGVVMMGIAGMMALYDYFPARLDEVTDGYLMIATSRNVNKIAYNYILLEQAAAIEGKPVPPLRVYDEVTDFTYPINLVSVYKAIEAKNYRQATMILDKAIVTEKGLSKQHIAHARTLKLSLMLETPNNPEIKHTYEDLDDSTKNFISALNTMAAIRAYALISAFIENSEGECNYAIEKAEKCLKAEDEAIRPIEKKLAEQNVEFIRSMHPGWDVAVLPWLAKSEDEEDEEAEDKTEDDKD